MSLDDADLYGDLYGADDPEYADGPQETKHEPAEAAVPASPPSKAAPEPEPSSSKTAAAAAAPPAPAPAPIPSFADEPPKPQPIPSYSSQIAEQFNSTYKQPTPERHHGLPSNPQLAGLQQVQSLAGNDQPGSSVRPSQMKDEGKMFVGGLNWDTSDEGLRNYFSQFGKVDACTIMRDQTGRSRGFAFLTFEDPAAVNAVMVREHYLDGKIIDPKRAIPRQEHHRTQKLFVGGLAPTVTTESLRAYFAQFGKVVDATVMVDRDSSRSKGFGFVTFEDIDNIERLLGLGHLEIDGKMIDVKLAQPRGAMIAQRDNHGGGGGYNQGASGGGGGGGGGYNQGGGAYGAGAGNYNAGGAPFNAPAAQGQGTPFDPQALAALYQRMFQQFGGAQGMGNMMNNMGGMGMAMGGGMGMGAGMGMGGMGMGVGGVGGGMGMAGPPMRMGGMARGGAPGIGPGVPRGPRGGVPPTGPAAMQNAAGGTGPMRAGHRGANNFHPYAR